MFCQEDFQASLFKCKEDEPLQAEGCMLIYLFMFSGFTVNRIISYGICLQSLETLKQQTDFSVILVLITEIT